MCRAGIGCSIDAVSQQQKLMTYKKAVSRQRYTMTYRKEQTLMTLYPDNVIPWRTWKNKRKWRRIPTTLYYDVPERTNANDAVSRQRYTMTYLKEQTLMTLYPDNVILWCTGKNKRYWRCIPTTLYHDVPERTNANDAVSRQRYTMYRKEQTLMTLYPDNVILCIEKNKR